MKVIVAITGQLLSEGNMTGCKTIGCARCNDTANDSLAVALVVNMLADK